MFKPYLNLPTPIYILSFGTLVNRAGTFLMFFLTLYLTTARGLGEQFATIAMGVFGIGAIAANFIGGHLADRVGRRTVMSISLWGAVIVLLIFGQLHSKGAILAGTLVFALIAEMYRPAASAMVADVAAPEQRTYAFGLIYLAVNLGSGVAALVGGTLATYSFQLLFYADAVTTALFALLILLTIRETLPLATAASGKQHGDGEEQALRTRNDVSILRNTVFVIFCAGNLGVALVYMQSWSTLPLYLNQLGYGPDVFGRIIAVNPLLIVILQIPITALVSRFPRGWMVLGSVVLTAIGFGATGLATLPLGFALTVVIWTLGEMMQAPLMPSIVSDLAPADYRARYMGVFSMCFASAQVIGAPIGGVVLTHYGGRTLWGACFALAMLSTMLFVVIMNRLSPPAAA